MAAFPLLVISECNWAALAGGMPRNVYQQGGAGSMLQPNAFGAACSRIAFGECLRCCLCKNRVPSVLPMLEPEDICPASGMLVALPSLLLDTDGACSAATPFSSCSKILLLGPALLEPEDAMCNTSNRKSERAKCNSLSELTNCCGDSMDA